MSARNGDRSRFGRVRRQKFLRRVKGVKLREVLAVRRATTAALIAVPVAS
jgi:hypothetical protein